MRRSIAAVAVLGAALVLSACSGDDGSEATATSTPLACASSGSASDSITATGDFGTKPVATIATPLSVDATEVSVLTAGEGPTAKEGDMVTLDYTVYKASDGTEIDASGYADGTHATFVLDPDTYLTGLVKAVNCANIGSRVAAVVSSDDAFGSNGNDSLGVAADEDLVFVIDVESVTPQVATGAPQPAVDGFPAVELAEDGTPTVSIPATEAPSTLQTEVLKKGDGATVADGDTLIVQYQGVIWRTGEVFDQSWGTGSPASFATGDVIAGFKDAVVGQTVGSQVVVIIPPDQGYGADGNSDAGIEGTDTLVFVIDILAIS